MNPSEIRQIAKGNELNIAVVGNQVFESSKYAPGLRVFPTKKWLFLTDYANEVPLQECADKAHMTLEEAGRFLETPKAKEWLERQAVIKCARQKWADGGEWLVTADECLEGKKHLAKDQQVAFIALGERFAPKPKQTEEAKTVIHLSVTAESVRAAIDRQSAIDADVA